VFEFLASPALTLAYYLFTFFSIEAALVVAGWQWKQLDSFRAQRLTMAFASLTVLRVVLFVVAVVGANSPEIRTIWLPPLERVVAIISLGFLVWGFTPYFRTNQFTGNVLLALNTVFAFLFYFLAVWFWDGPNFNYSIWEYFFVSWQMGLVLFGAVNSAVAMDYERTFALLGFGTMFAGYLLHLFWAVTTRCPIPPSGCASPS
jgi:hypothetical protein